MHISATTLRTLRLTTKGGTSEVENSTFDNIRLGRERDRSVSTISDAHFPTTDGAVGLNGINNPQRNM